MYFSPSPFPLSGLPHSDDSSASSPLLGGRDNSPTLLSHKEHTGRRVTQLFHLPALVSSYSGRSILRKAWVRGYCPSGVQEDCHIHTLLSAFILSPQERRRTPNTKLCLTVKCVQQQGLVCALFRVHTNQYSTVVMHL